MDISIYFEAIQQITSEDFSENTIGNSILGHFEDGHFPDLEHVELAVFGVCESRGSTHADAVNDPNRIREAFYALFAHQSAFNVADLGNIRSGETLNDTYFAVKDVVSELVKQGVIPIVIGGTQDLTWANYLGYEQLEQTINLCLIDAKLDIADGQERVTNRSFLSNIILHQPNFLFNCSNIGLQNYLNDPTALELMTKLYFDAYRLGSAQSDLTAMEPVIRNSDVVSIDVGAIRKSDMPSSVSGPNGFYGEQLCQLARYAGMSEKVSSFGLFEYDPVCDVHGQGAELCAQILWCFVDGYFNRKKENPFKRGDDFLKYRVTIDEREGELVFYKSKKSDRWWIDVPYPPAKGMKYERHHMVPCTYRDYQDALEDKMPERWWKTYQKLL